MRMLSLALFAVLALVVGAYEKDEITLLIGIASGLAAIASLPRWRISTFLTLLCDLFAIETVLFGLADLVALTDIGREASRNTNCPATCRWQPHCLFSPSLPSPTFAWCAG